MPSITVYPESGTGGTTTSRYVQREDGPSAAWSDTHDATAGNAVSAGGTDQLVMESYEAAGSAGSYGIFRSFFSFDTSAIGSSPTVSDAVLSLFGNDKVDGDADGNNFISIVLSTQANANDVVVGDYDTLGTTEQHDTGERKSITTISTSAYTDWTFNTTGKGNINKTGVTKLGGREGHDLLNDPISLNTDSYWRAYSADRAGTTNDPKLVVTYADAAGATVNIPTLAFMGAG